jgi:hypothetical protein
MDPNETLAAIRRELADPAGPDLDRLSDLVEALDGWLTRGGVPPIAWRPPDPLLTAHDHVITKAAHPVDGIHLPWAVHVAVHLYPSTPIVVRLRKPTGRTSLQIGAPGAELALFVDAGQIDRLANLLAVVRARLHP